MIVDIVETADLPSISIVVPVYGCVDSLKLLCARLREVLVSVTNRYEIILIDDHSPDDAWSAIINIQQRYSEVKAIRLSRNFGQHIAITAGLQASRGDYVVVMDCDLQDPPEKIPEMIEKLHEGYDFILARREARTHSFFRIKAAKIYFKMLSFLNKEDIDGSYGSFSLLTRKVVVAFLTFRERERHYLFILRWLGFHMGDIKYEHQERVIGSSSYSFGKLVQHAIDGIFFQTTVLLRWIIIMGFLFAFSGIIFAGYLVQQYFLHGAAEGWTSLATLILVCTGFIISSLGIVGMYISKIFDQSKERPLYIVDTISEATSTW